MAFTAEQFSEILETLRSDMMCGRDSEQRVNPRVGLRVKAEVACRRPDGGTVLQPVWIRDISVVGLGLVSPEPIEEGTYFLITFKGRNDKITVLYRVMRCGEAATNQFFIGGRFEQYVKGSAEAVPPKVS